MTINTNVSNYYSRKTNYPCGISINSTEVQTEIKSNENNITENEFDQLSDHSIEKQFYAEDINDFSSLEIEQNEYKRHKQIAKAVEAELEKKEFNAKCEESKKELDILKVKNNELFNFLGIKPADDDKMYPFSLEVLQDHTLIAPATIPLYTRFLRECTAVIVTGAGISGAYHALLHFSSFFDPEKVLTKIINNLKSKGCESDSIKVCLVGGQLPYIDKTESHNGTCIEEYCSGSVPTLSSFLSLRNKFNIVGVQFNLAGGEESLAVRVSQDEIVWTTNDFDFEDESIDEKDSDLVEHYTNPEEASSSEEESDLQNSESSENSSFEISDSSSLIKKNTNNNHSLKRKIDDEIIGYASKKRNLDQETIEVSPFIQKLLDECTIDNEFPGKKLLEDDDYSMYSQVHFNTLDL